MLKWLFILTGNTEWRTRDDDRRERQKFFEASFLFALLVVGPVSCAAALDVSGSFAVAAAGGVAGVFLPRAAASAVDAAARRSGMPALFAGRVSRAFLVFCWLGLLVASGVWLSARGALTFSSDRPDLGARP